MRTLVSATSLVLAVSPWILPLIAVAAKLSHKQARDARRGAFGQNRSGDRGNARTDGSARNQQAVDDCIEANHAGGKWPPQ